MFLYTLKAGPAGGLRPGSHTTATGEPASPSRQVEPKPSRAPWYCSAGCRARRKKEATYDLDHRSPADPRCLRRGLSQDRGPHVARQAGGAAARPAMEGHGWRIGFQAPDRWATSGPHLGHERPDRRGQLRSLPVWHLLSSAGILPHRPQLAVAARGSLAQKNSPAPAPPAAVPPTTLRLTSRRRLFSTRLAQFTGGRSSPLPRGSLAAMAVPPLTRRGFGGALSSRPSACSAISG